ncbi:SDR family NAD(P)-dependent oxidoreductase [Chitinophaga silvatica]|uniref:SDR family NAD(P)-dependent oxidoreductase n=1 Tax=Chitinophaga silvatica TaxID=2282649 RepID=A0A3E1YGP6_9BACT|nr:SDR family oxidoreductase [Chitinophaga silvatica]RFS26538.1 SDR family NAD(P)-dependent oxidoreductase [Chitinophaga silvatica]
MVNEFKGYWALILGGSSGLGLAAMKKLAGHGMNICVIHRNTRVELPAIQQQFEEIRSSGVELISFNVDVLNAEQRTEILQQLKDTMQEKKIRCLLHSIARGTLKSIPDLKGEDIDLTLRYMATSLYDWAAAVLEHQLYAPDARILAFTSDGSSKAMKHYAAVSVAKASLEAIIRSIALEMAPYGVRANCIMAGVTDTASLQRIPGSEEIISYSQSRNPFGRITTPEDVANVVYLLCKDEAAWINGAIIPVDGGTHIH